MAAFGDQSLKALDPQIWESLSEKIQLVTNLVDFKNSIKNGSVLNACATISFKNEIAENRP